ncbi:MAG TPA: hypothetical protein VKU60_07450, partial [Chloroflexota bacterium]|nr:hypothetical protein [Chloroflexota bacterium]
MRISFLHLADTRLGYRDPGDGAAFDQVAKQFRFAIDFAVDQRASFVVFSGNLFDSPEVEPETFQVALRGLTRLAEKNIAAIAIRGERELQQQPHAVTWFDMLSQEGLLASLEVGTADSQLALSRWERRDGRGSFADLGRCRIFGLHHFGFMTGALLQAFGKAVAALDNRETDFRILLLHAPLEHFTNQLGADLTYSDLLMLRRQLDYVGLGGCDATYESEGWVYNPGAAGFLHVTVDTAVQPKHVARYMAYPAALTVSRPPKPVRPPRRRQIEEA